MLAYSHTIVFTASRIQYIYALGNKMDEHDWIRLLPWRHKSKGQSKYAQISFVSQVAVTRENSWTYLELQLVNRSR